MKPKLTPAMCFFPNSALAFTSAVVSGVYGVRHQNMKIIYLSGSLTCYGITNAMFGLASLMPKQFANILSMSISMISFWSGITLQNFANDMPNTYSGP